MTITLTNRDARRLWLDSQGLSDAPTGPASTEALSAIIEKLGFVQIDTIRVVARAHNHILWSRCQNYREVMLADLIIRRMVFEHFTHDASIIPTVFYPNWRRQFERMKASVESSGWYKMMPSKKECEKILKRIADEGALSTRDFKAQKSKSNHAWARPPHKFALDYFWYAGVLATCHRKNFIKHYDLAERVIPAKLREKTVSDARQLDWLCTNALQRLGFASEGDIKRFWGAADLDEVKLWVNRRQKNIVDVEIKCADGAIFKASAFEDIEDRIQQLKAPTSRLRILNPFDPVIRDRNRLKRLFGFDYRVEMFTPAAKRQYGYYVYPMLEGDRFVGRIEVKADRKAGKITVENLWWESGVRVSKVRSRKLDAELERMARFIGVGEVEWVC